MTTISAAPMAPNQQPSAGQPPADARTPAPARGATNDASMLNSFGAESGEAALVAEAKSDVLRKLQQKAGQGDGAFHRGARRRL